ncbi:MAG: ATP synthase subunit C [Treponema sp.]|jgi:V/A-type H+-transporting ATPase subunit K|nr:ATP synthase subunit C [Treponema sp.]
MKRFVIVFALVLVAASQTVLVAQEVQGAATAASSEAGSGGNSAVWKYFAAALAVGISCIAGGIAVAQIGAAAMGAMSENADLSGKALPYAGLAEGICLWGFLVALLILIL